MWAGAKDGFGVRKLAFSPERVEALRAYAHARGATVNDTLIGALIRAVEVNNPQRAGLKPGVSISADTGGSPVVRILSGLRTSPPLRRSGWTSGTMRLSMRPCNTCSGCEAVQGHLVERMVHFGRQAAFAKNLARDLWFAATALRVSRAAAMVTMNVGSFDEERLVFGPARPVSAMVTGPIGRYAGFPLLISYYRGALTLWTGFRERFIASELVDRHIASIDAQLAEAESASATPPVAAEMQ